MSKETSKRILELGVHFPVFFSANPQNGIDLSSIPNDIILDSFYLKFQYSFEENRQSQLQFSLPGLPMQLILRRSMSLTRQSSYLDLFAESVDEELEKNLSIYAVAKMDPINTHSYNPSLKPELLDRLRNLRFAGTYPRYYYKTFSLIGQSFKLTPNKKELYEGRVQFGPLNIVTLPHNYERDEYNVYMRKNTWGMFYYFNESKPLEIPKLPTVNMKTEDRKNGW